MPPSNRTPKLDVGRCKRADGPSPLQRCVFNAGHAGDCMCVNSKAAAQTPPRRLRRTVR